MVLDSRSDAAGSPQEVRLSAARSTRPRGTGSLLSRRTKAGATVWYGKFRVNGEQRMVRLGYGRERGSRFGLTKPQLETELRRAIDQARTEKPLRERLTLEEAGERYLTHLELLGRRSTTLSDYRSALRVHLVPFFASRTLNAIDERLVEAFLQTKLRDGKAAKSIDNWLTLLGAIFRYAERRGWARNNPVALVDKPRNPTRTHEIRYLELHELETLINGVLGDELGGMERVLYRCAAMTGMRRGELLALRWRDVDWAQGVIRVRRSFTRGEFATTKSRRSSRAVPLADQLAATLEAHFKNSRFKRDDDLVFAHPATGGPYDPSKLQKRFKAAAARAGLRPARFHDLRHTFGTQMAAAGAPLRAVQEWLGHRDFRTTLIYADYAPDASQGAAWAARAFGDRDLAEELREQAASRGRERLRVETIDATMAAGGASEDF